VRNTFSFAGNCGAGILPVFEKYRMGSMAGCPCHIFWQHGLVRRIRRGAWRESGEVMAAAEISGMTIQLKIRANKIF
jgi:hypothetical protein